MRICEIKWQLTYHVHVVLKKPRYQTVKSPLAPVAERGRRICSFLAIHYYMVKKPILVYKGINTHWPDCLQVNASRDKILTKSQNLLFKGRQKDCIDLHFTRRKSLNSWWLLNIGGQGRGGPKIGTFLSEKNVNLSNGCII